MSFSIFEVAFFQEVFSKTLYAFLYNQEEIDAQTSITS